ncbi:MAG: phosphoglycerate kinase [Parachlamydiaceae bacterium]|nr:phosphoglycerate kinase [Parachlamydiaceae bacterium]
MTITSKLSITQLPLADKKVLMRVDYNVPLDKNGEISDDSRIKASLPSIRYALDQGASIILLSHFGRPKGKKDPSLSLAPCAKRLGELLGREVSFAPDCIGDFVEKLADKLQPGSLLMLENLRFHPSEEKPDEDDKFAQLLASLGDMYVNDAFGASHRRHSSITSLAKCFPGEAAAGLNLAKEVHFLEMLVKNPAHPFYAMIGGAKISTKIGALKSLVAKVDLLLIGGGMAYTFLKAQGKSIGNSLCEMDFFDEAQEILDEAKARGVKILLPIDHVVVREIKEDAETMIVKADKGILKGWQGVDIGPKTVAFFYQEIEKSALMLWNGPLGIFEIKKFSSGTIAIAKAIANLNGIKIVGGGDTLAAIKIAGIEDRITHLSTGGGATLEYLEFGSLPGIDALTDVTAD